MEYKMEHFFLFIWLCIIIIVVYQYNINKNKDKYKEGFTPKIKGLYRPYVRKLRLNVENFANKYNSNFVMNFLRKLGLY